MEGEHSQAAGELLLSYKPPSEQSENKIERKITPEDLFADRSDGPGNIKPNDTTNAQPNGVLRVDTSGNEGSEGNRTWEGIQDTRKFGPVKYNMSYKKRGCFLIFSQENFDNGMPTRKGTKIDAFNIFEAAAKLGFEFINTFHDSKKSEILNWLHRVSNATHAEYDCFGCAILTHGDKGDVLYARDAAMKLTDFTEPFTAKRCPSLVGKPKLFFVQACRGLKMDEGVEVTQNMDVVDGAEDENDSVLIPNEADFLLAQSTVPGYVAWLNSGNGSWFVQCFCECIHRFGGHMEIMQIMTRVNNMVAYQFKSSTQDGKDNYKQIPSITSRLTAELYFCREAVDDGAVQQSESQIQMVADEIEVHPSQSEQTPQLSDTEPPPKLKKKSLVSRIRKSFRRRRGTMP
uniref:Uncharacterized protein LOC100178691 n=1 Tax=Phallusia mammillata TaxID=59560 RepID=A0A6F9DG65_9ASCI|nr:uncharacterized protein LOC100178691 [Phallusia mammillata]